MTCGFTSILAVVFGHVSLAQIRRDGTDGRGMALAGVILGWVLTGAWIAFWALSWMGVISSFLYTAAYPTSGTGPARTPLDVGTQPGQATSAAPVGPVHLVTFEAVGVDGATSALNITNSQDFRIKQEQGVQLPYTTDVNYEGNQPHLYLWVQNAGTEGVVECRIKIDGQVMREAKSSGPYGVCQVTADKP